MRRPWIAVVVLIAAVGIAIFAASRSCGGGDGGDKSPTPSGVTATPDILPNATTEKEKLVLTLEVDSETYQVGEKITARARIKNNRADAVTYQAAAPGVPAFRLEVVDPNGLGGAQPMTPVGDSVPDQGSLDPGSEMQMEGEWDQQLDIPQDPIQAPAGKYSIRATFIAAVPGIARPVEVQAAATFRLEGGESVLLPLDVLSRVLTTPEFKSWMNGRADNVVCAYPPLGRFYQASIPSESAVESLDILYTSQQANGLPICGIGTDGDAWRLNFYSKNGAPPNRFNMLFNLHDGSLIRVEEVSPPPSPTPAP